MNIQQFGIFILFVVHNSGVISGSFMNNGAVRCGTLVCRPISGIFSKQNLINGYVHVATIPTGASNISITEMKHSINFLVLKSADSKYIINGDYSISQSGPYEAAGTVIDYRRIDGITNNTTPGFRKIEGITEWITCTGPTTEPLYLEVLAQQPNPGIKYEYLLPIHPNMISSSDEEKDNDVSSSELDLSTSVSEMAPKLKSATHTNSTGKPMKRKRQFLWKVVGFNSCSKSCGGGIQTPIIRCVREAPTRIFAPKRCAHLQQPILNDNLLKCNSQPCPAYWKTSDWSECNCGGYNEEVFKLREIKCVQELGSEMIIQVNNIACSEDPPLSQERCECPKYMKTPQLEVYKHVKPHHTHSPTDVNEVRHNIHGIPKNHTNSKRNHNIDMVSKKSGVWLVSDWNEHCSTECDSGILYRTIICDRSPPNIERCDLRFTPDTSKHCTSEKKCKIGKWFIGPWGECLGDCFNLKRSRPIYCIKNEEIISESECDIDEKPELSKDCQSDEVEDCRSKWHYSEWTKCTKTCDGGTQKRTIKCYEPSLKEKQLKESTACRYSERPTGYRNCNTHSCSGEVSIERTTSTEQYDPRVDLVQNDISTDCKDSFPNCALVIRAKLCNYAYYHENCCATCQAQQQ